MLEVQKYLLSGKTIENLQSEYAIRVAYHPTLPLTILNYDQLDSPKGPILVRECRGLVLNKEDWSLAAKSFHRFFNWGEMQEEMPLFNWDKAITQEKVDGSLILIFYFDGKWHSNTRGSFADGPMFGAEHQALYHKLPMTFTWKEGILRALGVNSLEELNLDKSITYVCEFCSLWNKVVRDYHTPCLYLLTRFAGEQEIGPIELEPFKKLQEYPLQTANDIIEYVNSHPEYNFEGCVSKDDENRRWKVKNLRYLALSKLKGNNGERLFCAANWLPFILQNDTGEALATVKAFPEVEEFYLQIDSKIQGWKKELDELWEEVKDIPEQKEYALKVKDHRLSSLMFQARKDKIKPSKLFIMKYENVLLKRLEKK